MKIEGKAFNTPLSGSKKSHEDKVNDHSSFVHLHVHTEYSLLDGAIRTDQLLKKCHSLGMNAVAITDHGNMFGAVQFYDQAAKAEIKPFAEEVISIPTSASVNKQFLITK